MKIFNEEECKLVPFDLKVKNEIVIDEYFKVICKNYDYLKIVFDMFFDNDKTQEGVLKIFTDTNSSVLLFNYNKRNNIYSITKNNLSFLDVVKLEILHILEGFDHLTFLLMLPVIAFYNTIKKSILQVFAIATMFTLSHSITLSLSAFNIIIPPEKLIKVLIAFSIFLTAMNNLFHFVSYKKEWLLVFLFGFIHGFVLFMDLVLLMH